MGYWLLQRLEKSFSSLAVCYAFLASLAALLLIYVRVELQANPPDWSNFIGGLIHGSTSIRAIKGAQLLAGAQSALSALRDRMHTTWLFFAVFAAFWLACLIWMQIERHRRGIDFTRREAYWTVGFSIAVFALAVLYGLGTNGILARRFPGIVPVADIVALGILLALPLAAWSRLGRSQQEQEDADLYGGDPAPGRSRGFLGLDEDTTNARLAESLSRIEVKPVDMLPAVHAFHPETPSEPADIGTNRPIQSTVTPTAVQNPEVSPSVAATTTSASVTPAPVATPAPIVAPLSEIAAQPAGVGIQGFRHHLAAMNQSWQRIEVIRGEIDNWFELQRREAIAHLDSHPGMRTSALEKSLFQNFPSEKLAAVDAEWVQIRKSAFEISRWFGEVPAPDQER